MYSERYHQKYFSENFSPASPSIFLESGVQFFDIYGSIIYCLSRYYFFFVRTHDITYLVFTIYSLFGFCCSEDN